MKNHSKSILKIRKRQWISVFLTLSKIMNKNKFVLKDFKHKLNQKHCLLFKALHGKDRCVHNKN